MDALEASQLLTDEYSAKILLATFKKRLSALELSNEYGIPLAACYRKLARLEDSGLIECVERKATDKGKRISLYQSRLKQAYIFFENGKLRARFYVTGGLTKDFGGDWTTDSLQDDQSTPDAMPTYCKDSSSQSGEPVHESDKESVLMEPNETKEGMHEYTEELHTIEETLRILEQVTSASEKAAKDLRRIAARIPRSGHDREADIEGVRKVGSVSKEAVTARENRSKRGEKA